MPLPHKFLCLDLEKDVAGKMIMTTTAQYALVLDWQGFKLPTSDDNDSMTF